MSRILIFPSNAVEELSLKLFKQEKEPDREGERIHTILDESCSYVHCFSHLVAVSSKNDLNITIICVTEATFCVYRLLFHG